MHHLIPSFLLTPAGLGLLLLAACSSSPATPDEVDTTDDDAQATAVDGSTIEDTPRFGSFGFDTDGMDRNHTPGDDFYLFANGTWEQTEEIPSDRPRYGVFDKLSIEAEEDVQALIEAAVDADAEPGSNEQLVGDFFQSWMNEEAIEEAGLDPAQSYLDEIDALESHRDVAALMAELHFPALYSVGILPDPADPTVYAARSGQGGLGMPNRDYYLDDSEQFEYYRAAYRDYITTLHELAGLDDAQSRADAIIDLETRLAEVHWSRERSREITETYNVLTIDEYAALAPALQLDEGLETRGLTGLDEIIVSQPSAIEETGAIFEDTDLQTLKDYLSFHFLSSRASWLPRAFDEAHFNFFSRTLSGTEEQRDRDRRGTRLINRHLGHAIGQTYVENHFPPEASEQMSELVNSLTEGFKGRLERLDWMDDETRQEALKKLSTFEPRIGYPEIWDSFEDVRITDDDYFQNRIQLTEHRWDRDLKRFPEPVDRRHWNWPPQMVNASYHPLMNQITFPAGILQAPFFDPAADAAINYGAIGAVIGHEIGHGFDDQGRRFDAQGQLRDWWTEDTDQRFTERSDLLVEQFSQFCPLDDACINGRLALGENIGDLGGMEMAYVAYRNHVEETYPDGQAPILDGFTGDQRFFLAWAQVWRSLYREDALRAQLVNGPHSPGMYRVNGVVRNIDAWYDAFDVEENHDLYLPPEERVSIW